MVIPGASSSSRADSLILLNTPAGSSELSSVATHVGLDDAIVLGGISGNGDVVHKGATLKVVPCTAFSRRDRYLGMRRRGAGARTHGRTVACDKWPREGGGAVVCGRGRGACACEGRRRRHIHEKNACQVVKLERRLPAVAFAPAAAQPASGSSSRRCPSADACGRNARRQSTPGVDIDSDAGECNTAPPLCVGWQGREGPQLGRLCKLRAGTMLIPFMAHYNALVGTLGVLVWDDLAMPCVHADRGALVLSSSCVRGGAAEAGRVGWRARGRAVSRMREGARWATDQERTSKGLDEEGNS
ncbi:hypothetical protein GGX14DRAFT_407050 [Mycena pura]|uniref:Uncharacterized protein n=1 Tax=Mycena pura TaxID=153505 RepID=A0AAD6Y0W4_9AGAR|nr:hypothetical protein GGX14DRAFT_407050 [Mycena pura]